MEETTGREASDVRTVIEQYYTLINERQYEEAYHLLSSTKPNRQSYEDYLAVVSLVESVKVSRVMPYNEWAKENGRSIVPDEENKKNYFVEITGSGKGNMLGPSVADEKQLVFIKMIQEAGEWKIYSSDTAPFR